MVSDPATRAQLDADLDAWEKLRDLQQQGTLNHQSAAAINQIRELELQSAQGLSSRVQSSWRQVQPAMQSPTFSDQSGRIAQKYGDDATKGIWQMVAILQRIERKDGGLLVGPG